MKYFLLLITMILPDFSFGAEEKNLNDSFFYQHTGRNPIIEFDKRMEDKGYHKFGWKGGKKNISLSNPSTKKDNDDDWSGIYISPNPEVALGYICGALDYSNYPPKGIKNAGLSRVYIKKEDKEYEKKIIYLGNERSMDGEYATKIKKGLNINHKDFYALFGIETISEMEMENETQKKRMECVIGGSEISELVKFIPVNINLSYDSIGNPGQIITDNPFLIDDTAYFLENFAKKD